MRKPISKDKFEKMVEKSLGHSPTAADIEVALTIALKNCAREQLRKYKTEGFFPPFAQSLKDVMAGAGVDVEELAYMSWIEEEVLKSILDEGVALYWVRIPEQAVGLIQLLGLKNGEDLDAVEMMCNASTTAPPVHPSFGGKACHPRMRARPNEQSEFMEEDDQMSVEGWFGKLSKLLETTD